jgi:hypothetical protein
MSGSSVMSTRLAESGSRPSCAGWRVILSMRTLATSVDAGRFRWSVDESRRTWTLTGVLAAARVAAPGPTLPCGAARESQIGSLWPQGR